MRPRAIIYAAKSTSDPRGSLGAQAADCRAMAEREGWQVLGEYRDEAASGWSGNRGPDLARAMAHAEAEAPCVLVVQHSDRLARGDARQARHLVEVVTWAVKSHVTIRSVEDDLFADERLSVLMGALMGMRNSEDSHRKSEATKAGKRRAWERGKFGGGPTPDGFELVRDGEEKIPRLDPKRIGVIRQVGALADEGWGDHSIARELNRRGLRTKGGRPWTRSRIQDLLLNSIYYGGVAWRRNRPDEEINWDASHPAPWTREDYERRRRARAARDSAPGTDRRPGRPHANHALAGLAICGKCLGRMRPTTSSYRRKDGSRQRTYVCSTVDARAGDCDAAPIDAELIDAHVVNSLQRYLGDFELWRDQLLAGYASERQRLERELANAVDQFNEQERATERADRLGAIATNEAEAQAALRIAAKAHQELERREARLDATQRALDGVPSEAPADAMFDFYSELGAAVRGRLEGAHTLARVNDALRDLFACFVLEPPPRGEGIIVRPLLRADLDEGRDGLDLSRWITDEFPDEVLELARSELGLDPRISPPLRQIKAPEGNRAMPRRPSRRGRL
jgi:site-specific DNA recombinase